MTKPQTCTRCVMDTSDPDLTFDLQGVCNHCRSFDALKQRPNTYSKEALSQLVEEMKKRGRHRKYDCIAAISGGTDSSYMLHCLKTMGLRVLAVHFDGGWNTEEASQNVQSIIDKIGLELYTYTVDWEAFKSVQLAYLRSGVIDLELVTDHALFAALYEVAEAKDAAYIVTGQNMVTEYFMPKGWVFDKNDAVNLLDIYKHHGPDKPLKNFPLLTPMTKFRYYNMKRIELVFLLNYLTYDKEEATETLKREYGWTPYWVKHGESIWTRFYQCYILPQRFGVDKRKAHFGNMIASGQITRQAALNELEQPIYPKGLEEDKRIILERFGLSEDEFEDLMKLPHRKHSDFRTEKGMKELYHKVRGVLELMPLSGLLRTSAVH